MFEDEHYGHAHAESGPELAVRAHWVALGLIAAIAAGGNVQWALDLLVAFGLLGPILMYAINHSSEGSFGRWTLRFLGWMIPAWVVLVIFLAGLPHPAFTWMDQGARQVWEMLPLPPAWVPVAAERLPAAISVVFLLGLYGSALNALLIPQGRLVFARTWAILILCAGLLALLGLVQRAIHLDSILWIFPIANPRFFATFPHPAQWCAFALLWMSAGFGLLAWLVRQRGWRWLSADGWLLLAMTALLGVSVVFAGNPLHRLLGAVVAAVGCTSIAWQTWKARAKSSGFGIAGVIWALAALAMVAGIALIYSHHHGAGDWIRYAGDRPGFSLHARVIEDTKNMWHERPWFGWGQASFPIVYSFFQQSDQGYTYWAFARSDFWQSLAENGMVGTVVWWLPVLWIGIRLLLARRLASFLIAPLAGLAVIVGLSIVDFPFASPAVFFGFWLILFSLARWSEVDSENTTSTISERRRVAKERTEGKTLVKPAPVSSPPAA